MTEAEESRRRRTRYDLAANIIEAALKPARQTDIAYRSFLNFSLVDRYLEYLIAVGLIQRYKDSLYEATKSGLEYLETYRRIKHLFETGGDEGGVRGEAVPSRVLDHVVRS